jgi:hypothetical protein
VSLLERLARSHLSERQIASVWTSGGSHPHLDACDACRARMLEFEQWIGGIADELQAEADEAVSAEQLTLQQAQIARRIESLDRPGRIIAFPKAARAVINGHSHVRRWVTVAAAAGLIAGVGLGQVVPVHRYSPARTETARTTPPLTTPDAAARARGLTPASVTPSDDELLSDALFSPRVKDLRALDDMTPHVKDLRK